MVILKIIRQWRKFVAAYKNKEYTRSHVRYRGYIYEPLSIREIASLTHRSHWSVRDALGGDEKLGLVRSFRKRIGQAGHRNKFYTLTERCIALMKVLNG